MFGRSKSDTSTPSADQASTKVGGKGRPTPTRREAEAAAKARAKAPRTRQEQAAAGRSERKRALDGLKAGDEKYLTARDRGPMRRFVRDFVDSRFSFIEIMVPLLLASMILGTIANTTSQRLGNILMLVTLMMVVVDFVTLKFRLNRELARRFPGESTRGITWYSFSRALQMKFMRLPKPQVRIGEQLPEKYR
ncbi:MAG: DUF3043 domain-containing protein [Nocardioides sp.]|uniref:DUF3043 domain-containing protein n=1 Tax=Nocardioides sp. TaxID=35761 RepID=UPI003F059989